ncbi:LIMA1 protein, partial [Polyodon spathula]|nr:LIMA1 protein [Polyodon spathula]
MHSGTFSCLGYPSQQDCTYQNAVSLSGKPGVSQCTVLWYQKAAEEANTEKRRADCLANKLPETARADWLGFTMKHYKNPENLTRSFRRGNLSVLKKRWETTLSTDPQPNPAPRPRLPSTVSPTSAKPDTPAQTDQNHVGRVKSPGSAPSALFQFSTEREEGMERTMSREGGEAAPASPVRIEKSSVQLNSLKMMFEKGDSSQDKVGGWLRVATVQA